MTLVHLLGPINEAFVAGIKCHFKVCFLEVVWKGGVRERPSYCSSQHGKEEWILFTNLVYRLTVICQLVITISMSWAPWPLPITAKTKNTATSSFMGSRCTQIINMSWILACVYRKTFDKLLSHRATWGMLISLMFWFDTRNVQALGKVLAKGLGSH